MDAISRRKQLITRLIRAARGQYLPPAPVDARVGALPPTPRQKNITLPCFPLKRQHVGKLPVYRKFSLDDFHVNSAGGIASPDDFHSFLCERINSAQERIVLASLYIGVGSGGLISPTTAALAEDKRCKEDELLQALHNAAANNNLQKMQILLDANRALRKVSVTTNRSRQSHGAEGANVQTNSAEAILAGMDPFIRRCGDNINLQSSINNGLFLFPVHGKRLRTILPSPLNEVAGVFHIKAYIVDDMLILSGANLSEEYFCNRVDRYMLFTNGGGGLVNFYSDLCEVLCEYAIRYDGPQNESTKRRDLLSSLMSSRDEKDKKQKLELSLMRLFDGNFQSQELEDSENDEEVVAYAIPTFQIPTSFLDRPICIPSDTEVTQNLLLTALDSSREYSASVRLSSAYLNLTRKLLAVLTQFGRKTNVGGAPYILTAGPISHGFAPKKGGDHRRRKTSIVEYVKATIPKAFLILVQETAQSITSAGGKVFLYEREGWTYHAKGVWVTANDVRSHHHTEMIQAPSSLLATIIGSSNYGARSEDLDVESNCIIIFKDDSSIDDDSGCNMKHNTAAEWNDMCRSSKEWNKESRVNADGRSSIMRLVLELLKRYL